MRTTLLLICLGALIQKSQAQTWSEDFEGDWTQNWYASNGVWDVGVPTVGPANVPSDSSCAATNLTGSYPDGANTRFIRYTPFQVPPSGSKPRMRFTHWFSTHGWDIGRAQIKTPSSDWTNLTEYTYSGSCSNSWTIEELDLSLWSDSSVTIAFLLTAGSSAAGNPPGWYIDDVEVLSDPIIFSSPEDFESGIGAWSVDRGSWQVGAPAAGVGPSTCHSGIACAGTALAGNYADGISTRLRTPWLTLGNGSSSITFWHWYSTHAWDICQVRIRTPNTLWTGIGSQWSGSSAGWTFYYLDLSAYSDSIIRIGFDLTSTASAAGNPAGWYLDDITVSNVIDPIVTGVPELNEAGIPSWPNPFHDRLFLRSTVGSNIKWVRINSSLGQEVRTLTPSSDFTMWDGRNSSGTEVPPGVYLITMITDDGQRHTQRVVKQ